MTSLTALAEYDVRTEEIFGPVMPITVAGTEEEALRLVNRHHAMMNSVFTRDHMRGLAFARRVASNEVHVNDGYTPVTYPAWARTRS